MLSAPGLPGRSALETQFEDTLRISNVSGEDAQAYRALFREYMEIVGADLSQGTTRLKLIEFLRGPGRALVPPYGFLPQDAESLSDVLLGAWYQSNLNFEPATAYEQLSIPVLAIGGGKDIVAPPHRHLTAIERIVSAAPTHDIDVRVLDGLNHLLQDARTGLPNEYAKLETSFSPSALEVIEHWLSARFQSSHSL